MPALFPSSWLSPSVFDEAEPFNTIVLPLEASVLLSDVYSDDFATGSCVVVDEPEDGGSTMVLELELPEEEPEPLSESSVSLSVF